MILCIIMVKQKLYSISELINENIKLKKDLEQHNKAHLINIISMIKLLKDTPRSSPMITNVINAYSKELEKYG